MIQFARNPQTIPKVRLELFAIPHGALDNLRLGEKVLHHACRWVALAESRVAPLSNGQIRRLVIP